MKLKHLALVVFVTAFISPVAFAEELKWYDRMSFGGDLRYRHESVDKSEKDSTNHRQRLRLRLKTEAAVEDNTKVVVQLATGAGEANSTNQTLDGTYNKKEIYLDHAYVQVAPGETFKILAGKVKNTFVAAGDSELLWDADLSPEGVALNWSAKKVEGQNHQFFANVAGYFYDERDAESGPAASDIMQHSAQVGANFGKSVLGVGHHVLAPTEGRDVPVGSAGNGNTLSGNQYANGFEVYEVFISWVPAETQWKLYAHYVTNGAADENNQGYLAGFTYGKTADPGDWSLDYNYRATEADAVLGYLHDSDFASGETDSRGHRFKASYQFGQASTAGLTYMVSERSVSGTAKDYDRAQLDFSFKF